MLKRVLAYLSILVVGPGIFGPRHVIADPVHVLVVASRIGHDNMLAGIGTGWNLWLPDTQWWPVDSLQETAIAPAGAPSADASLVGVFRRYGIASIRHRYEPGDWQTSIPGPLGDIDLSFLDACYEVLLADTGLVELFCSAIDSLPRFHAEFPLDGVEFGFQDSTDVSAAPEFSSNPPVNDPFWRAQSGYAGIGPDNPNHMNLPDAWQTTTGDTAVIVGILDKPVRWSHHDLAARQHLGFVGGGAWHGTVVASIIGALTNNNFGMAGVDWNATLAVERVSGMDISGADPNRDLTKAYRAMMADGAQITNHSYYWPDKKKKDYSTPEYPMYFPAYYTTPHRVLVAGYNAGVIHIAAANERQGWDIGPPGSLDESVICVTALDENGIEFPGVGHDSWIDFAAQGEDIVAVHSQSDTSMTTSASGTSFSTPLVTGLVSLAYAYGLSVDDTLDSDDMRGILGLGMMASRVPQLDSALKLMRFPNCRVRYVTSGEWTETARNRNVRINGINGLAYSAYTVREHRLVKYFTYPDDYYAVYGVWANGPRSSGAMPMEASGIHSVLVPAKWASVDWHGPAACSVSTYYYTQITDAAEKPCGSYPFSSADQAVVALTVVGQRRLPVLDAHAAFFASPEQIDFWTGNPENDERLVVDLRAGAADWQTGYRVLTGADTAFSLTDLQGSQTYSFRVHAETYNQIAPAGAVATITSPPHSPRNLTATVGWIWVHNYYPAKIQPDTTVHFGDPGVKLASDGGDPEPDPEVDPVDTQVYTNRVRVRFAPPLNQAVAPAEYVIKAYPEDGGDKAGDPHSCEVFQGIADTCVDICLDHVGTGYTIYSLAKGYDAQLSFASAPADITTGSYRVVCEADKTAGQSSPVRDGSPTGGIELLQNHPNPFNAATTIDFYLPEDDLVSLNVFNILGQQVANLEQGSRPAGWHTVRWDGTGSDGKIVPSGIYICRLSTSRGLAQARQMAVLK